MIRALLPFFAALSGLVLSGCATITRGTTDDLLIQSEPEGASVELSSGQTCRTPCSLELKRKNDYTLYIRKEGFQDADVKVDSKVAGAGAAGMAGNVLIGGLIGAGVDAFSGATNSLAPNPVHVHLLARDAAQADVLCQPAATVPGAACRGLLRPGTSAAEVEQLLGPPQDKMSSGREWKYGHDVLVFDEAGLLTSTIVEK
jgi:hypothetical protein